MVIERSDRPEHKGDNVFAHLLIVKRITDNLLFGQGGNGPKRVSKALDGYCFGLICHYQVGRLALRDGQRAAALRAVVHFKPAFFATGGAFDYRRMIESQISQ